MKAGLAGVAALAVLLGAGIAVADAGRGPAGSGESEATHALTAMINRQIRAEGSFFTPKEQQMVIDKCGYKPGEWDGYDVNMSNGVFHCTNGRNVSDPEMKAIMAAVAPRIERRVGAIMASREVRSAIDRVAAEATAAAMQRMAERHGR